MLGEHLKRSLGYCDRDVWVDMPVKVVNPAGVSLHQGVSLSWNGWLYAVERFGDTVFDNPEIIIRERTYVGAGFHIVACRRIEIGRDCMLGDRVYISDNCHRYADPAMSIHEGGLDVGEVIIGDGTWIGENACVFGDVRIGKRCVIGANSVVRKSLPDHSVAVGAPARVVKRFDPETDSWRKTDAEGGFLAQD